MKCCSGRAPPARPIVRVADYIQRTERIATMKARLPVLTPEQDVALLEAAGVTDVQLFYCGLTFKGWVAYRS